MSSNLLELVIKAVVATSAAIGSPDGELRHRKRYELLGYSYSMVIFCARQSFMFVQTLDLRDLDGRAGLRTMFVSKKAALNLV
jgi:hypothetical protein